MFRRHRHPWDGPIPGSPEWLGVMSLPPLMVVTAGMIGAAIVLGIFLHRSANEIVTTRCAQRWFEETTALGGLTVEYESTSCDFSDESAATIGCSVPVEDFEPAYVECRLVSQTLFGSCDCEMPAASEVP
jgi:hypothetical protein